MNRDPDDLGIGLMIITKEAWEKQKRAVSRLKDQVKRLQAAAAELEEENKARRKWILDQTTQVIANYDAQIADLQAIIDNQRERIVDYRFEIEVSTEAMLKWTAILKAMRTGSAAA